MASSEKHRTRYVLGMILIPVPLHMRPATPKEEIEMNIPLHDPNLSPLEQQERLRRFQQLMSNEI